MPNKVPFVEASNHLIVLPAEVAANVVEAPKQKDDGVAEPAVGAVGNPFTVTVVVIIHPLLSVYVITLVPALTPVTSPVALTVALAVVADIQGLVAAAVPDPVNCNVVPTQSDKILPVLVIVGKAFIVIAPEASLLALLLHGAPLETTQ